MAVALRLGGACRAASRHGLGERRGVDHVPVAHGALDGALVRLVDLVGRDEFVRALDGVQRAKVEHLLRLADAADERAGEHLARRHERERLHRDVLGRQPHTDLLAVLLEQVHVRAHVKVGGDAVEDHVERARRRGHLLRVAHRDVLVRAQRVERLGPLGLGARQHRHLDAHRLANLDGHRAETAQPGDAELHPRPQTVVHHGRVHGDPGAQQRRRTGQREPVGHFEHVVLVDNDALRVAAVRGRAAVVVTLLAMLVLQAAVVGADHAAADAVLLLALLALLTLTARIDHAADADAVAHGERLHLGADSHHKPRDLVTRHHRKDGRAPLLARLVDVGMADAGILDLDRHIVRTDGAALDLVRHERRAGLEGGVAEAIGGHGC
mmetsp:Transcript_61967/g.170268  ORF Transcript_61967/g.170268 Transcript_61967/m.170268 type:complete len:382 (+) Transcript_61967:320-1465(+)